MHAQPGHMAAGKLHVEFSAFADLAGLVSPPSRAIPTKVYGVCNWCMLSETRQTAGASHFDY